jgi:hypothetical protein
VEISELKHVTSSHIKNSPNELNTRVVGTEEGIKELAPKTTEINLTDGESKMEKNRH